MLRIGLKALAAKYNKVEGLIPFINHIVVSCIPVDAVERTDPKKRVM